MFSLKLLCFSADAKCSAPLSVNLLFARFKLFSLQLLCFSAAAKCSAPLSVNSLTSMFKLRDSSKINRRE